MSHAETDLPDWWWEDQRNRPPEIPGKKFRRVKDEWADKAKTLSYDEYLEITEMSGRHTATKIAQQGDRR